MAGQDAYSLPLEGVPNVTVEVVVAGEQNPARHGKADRGNTTQNVVVLVNIELAVRSQIEKSTRSVVGPSGKCVAVGEESEAVSSAWPSAETQKKTYWTALMSDSCPTNVWTAFPVRISHTLAVASQAPETNTFWFGDPSDRLRECMV
jgi:hypothetical protein